MYSIEILERFKNPENAGGMRGADGTGKAGEVENGNIVKIYLSINEKEIIENAKFKTYGGVLAIAGSDIACELIQGGSVEHAMKITSGDIVSRLGSSDSRKIEVATIIEDAIKNAVEDYYKKKEKEDKKSK